MCASSCAACLMWTCPDFMEAEKCVVILPGPEAPAQKWNRTRSLCAHREGGVGSAQEKRISASCHGLFLQFLASTKAGEDHCVCVTTQDLGNLERLFGVREN